MSPQEDPLAEWKRLNNPSVQAKHLIRVWLDAHRAIEKSLSLAEDGEKWLLSTQAEEGAPDLVQCCAEYGYSRLLTQDWTTLPIDIPVSEHDRWRSEHYTLTIEEFRDRQAGAAGGFLELRGHAPGKTSSTIVGQLNSKVSQLRVLAAVTVEEYTPRQLTDEDIEDGDDIIEQRSFDRPFALRQELECFAWGLQKLRMYCITQDVTEIGLPNKELFDAFNRIDLNELTATLGSSDFKLKEILKHLARHDYFSLDNPIDPESFWWRHWRAAPKKSPSGMR